ncbi:MAG: alpha/beta hydrolase [Rhodobacteraceae bacterium]|nr:MAG: alpha/beta hydrolase [Paracoccaceae bacterium]
MSLIARLLTAYLRLVEKRRLARAQDPGELRRAFARNARLFFHPPRGTRFRETIVAGLPATEVNAAGTGPLILYLHGGGYIFGAPRTHRALLACLSAQTGCPALLPDYRKAPEHGFPAALDDAMAVYRQVMHRPGGVILGGDSAGGGLALALLAEVLRQGLPQPLGLFAFSPLTDMTCSGASLRDNAERDALLPAGRTGEIAGMYLQGADPRDPRASPLFAGFTGASPIWLTASDCEILRDDTCRMAARLRDQGVAVSERIEPGLPHVWPLFHNLLPEARRTLRLLAAWISSLSPRSADS